MRKTIGWGLCIVLALSNISHAWADGIKNQGFILNQGQWPDSVWSRGSFSFGDVIVKKDGIQFFLRDKNIGYHAHGKSGHDDSDLVNAHVYNMKFKNTTLGRPQGLEAADFKIHYLKGNDPSKWINGLTCHRKLLIENLYRNIDLVLYLTDGGVKYDLILKDKANPSDIVIQYEGVDSLMIDAEGHLQILTSLGTITEHIPAAYVEKSNLSKEPVSCKYQLQDRTIRFDMKHVSKARQEKLVIDPQLIFSTYSGSYADNWGNSATYDSSGAAYIAGIAFDAGFPATIGAFQIHFNSVISASVTTYASPNGDPDVAIMKFDATGKMVYATYLGGGLSESPTSTITNDQGELYILGTTGSRGFALGDGVPFPTTLGAYSRTFKGGTAVYPLGEPEFIYHHYGTDLFVSRLSADGSMLLSSTLVGGSSNDGLLQYNETLSRNYGDEFRSEILLDSLGYVYIASHTQSNDIINTTKPGYDHSFNGAGGRDGIVMKLKPDLSDIVWNTYYGGSGLDACYSLQFGLNNDLYITGGTTSADLPVSPNAMKPYYSGNIDGFVLRLSNDGTSLLNATYIGTSSIDQCQLIQTDTYGSVYVLGQTQGQYPIVNAPYSNGASRQFIHKLNNTLTNTLFSTTIGSGRAKTDFVPTAFLVNDCGKILLSGWGGDLNYPESYRGQTYGIYYQSGGTDGLPVTNNAFQKTTDGSDFYLMLLDKDVHSLLYATFFGGNNVPEHVDGGTSRFDKRGIVYESVCACTFEIRDHSNPNYPVTPGAHSSKINSYDCNNAIFKFDLNSLDASFRVDTADVCGTKPITFTNTSSGGSTFTWNLGDGTTSTSSSSFTHVYKQPGTYTATLIISDPVTCKGKDTAEKIIHVYALPSAQFTSDTAIICKGDTAQLTATYNPNYTYSWTPNQYLSSTTISDPLAYPPTTQVYTVTLTDQTTQCKTTDSVQVMVVRASADTYYQNLTSCQGQAKIFVHNASDKFGFNYLWNFGDGATSTDAQETNHTYTNYGTYTVSVTVSNQSCSVSDTLQVTLSPIKIPNLFTPNGDNHNDKYVIEGMPNNWQLDVFNSWGDLIYTRKPYDQSWGGEGLSGGVYYFLITDSSGNKCKGWVEVFK